MWLNRWKTVAYIYVCVWVHISACVRKTFPFMLHTELHSSVYKHLLSICVWAKRWCANNDGSDISPALQVSDLTEKQAGIYSTTRETVLSASSVACPCQVPVVKMNAAQFLLQRCSWPRRQVKKANADYRAVWWQRCRSHKRKLCHTGWAVDMFVEMCKKINLTESQGSYSLTSLSSQYSCLHCQFFIIFSFEETTLNINI